MITDTNFKDTPICTFIATSIIVVFLLFYFKLISSVKCTKSIDTIIINNFVHVDFLHLLSNLYALYSISRVEKDMGIKSFVGLLVFLLIINSLAEFFIQFIWKDSPCTIGFSGILFGLFTWELTYKNKIDSQLILAIILMVIQPSLHNEKVSLSGHIIGAVSGIIAGFLWKFINK